MALDFTILDSDGKPSESVSLGVDAHAELIALGRAAGTRVTGAFEDYYSDARIDVERVAEAKSQLGQLRKAQASRELEVFLVALDSLLDRATDTGKALYIIAD